jgi:hypothetical protein
MMKGRRIATVAALGTSTAALAMLTGLAGARADELSDMRLNQQLLSQRIDQLAAVGLAPDVFSVNTNPAASAPTTAGSFPRSILIPGTDTSLKVYGEIDEVIDYWMSGGNPNGSPQSTTVGINGQSQTIPVLTNGAGAVGHTILGASPATPVAVAGTTTLANAQAHARSDGIFQQSPRQSKLGFETRTPTPLGEARTLMEFDWAGSSTFVPGGADPLSSSDNLVPRLKYAYGTLGGFLAGQATSNFSDPDANAEALDFGGNAGEPGHVRIPQVRYTVPVPFGFGGSFSVSAETPETDIYTANGLEASDAGVIPTATTSCLGPTGIASPGTVSAAAPNGTVTCSTTLLTSGVTPLNPAKAAAPDFTMAWYLPQAWGHFDVSAVIRPGLDVTDGKFFAKNYIGYGGHFGMDFKPGWFGWAKDDFTVHFTLGEALGSYLNSTTNFALVTNYGLPATSGTNGIGAAATNAQAGTYGGFNGPTSAAAASMIIVKPTFEMGGEVGYQHWWADNLRSNINAGFNAHSGIPIALVGGNQGASINKEIITAHANLIWNPVSSVDIGLEYMWGQRTVLNNATATENVLISKFAFRF